MIFEYNKIVLDFEWLICKKSTILYVDNCFFHERKLKLLWNIIEIRIYKKYI